MRVPVRPRPNLQCIATRPGAESTMPPVRRKAATEALGDTERRLVGEAAAADGEGTIGREASDERGAARLAGVECGGIARAPQKALFPYHPQETV